MRVSELYDARVKYTHCKPALPEDTSARSPSSTDLRSVSDSRDAWSALGCVTDTSVLIKLGLRELLKQVREASTSRKRPAYPISRSIPDASCGRAPNPMSPSDACPFRARGEGLHPNHPLMVRRMRQYDARASGVTPKRPKIVNASMGDTHREK